MADKEKLIYLKDADYGEQHSLTKKSSFSTLQLVLHRSPKHKGVGGHFAAKAELCGWKVVQKWEENDFQCSLISDNQGGLFGCS